MWLWRPSARNKRILWIKLFLASCGLHVFGLLLVLVAYRGYYAHYDITLNHIPDVPVVFMPLHKSMHVRSGKQREKRIEKTGASTSVAINKPEQPSLVQPQMVQRQSTVKQSPTTVVVEQKKIPKKVVAKKNKKKKVEKTTTDLAQKNKKQNTAVDNVVQQTVLQQQVPVTPLVQQPIMQERAVVPEPIPSSSDSILEQQIEIPQGEINQSLGTHNDQDVLCVGQVEWDALQVQEQIQQELEQHWNPPRGLNGETACQIKVVIDWSGSIKQVTTQISSGVLAFDVHARSTVFAMHFPKVAWGKELILHFK